MYHKKTTQQKIPFTQHGYQKLRDEKISLLSKRPEAISELARARELGDLKENGFYRGAKFKVQEIDRRLREINHLLSHALIVHTAKSTNFIGLGALITLLHDDKEVQYQLVGEYETDPDNHKISQKSPLGSALVGKKAGQTISVKTPTGLHTYTILTVSLP